MANSRSPRRRGMPARQLSRIRAATAMARTAPASARPARARTVQVSDDAAAWAAPAEAPDSDARVGWGSSPSSHGGLFSLVVLLILIMSLAIRARSRAWVVFRWVGVAAPAQRYVRGMAHRTAARFPDRCGRGRGCGATARSLRHSEGECGRPGAGLLYGTRSAAGNPPGYPDPVVGGSLEDDFCDLIS